MIRKINNFTIETIGGFITIKYWTVINQDNEFKGIFFKFGAARTACLNNDFSGAYKGRLYD